METQFEISSGERIATAHSEITNRRAGPPSPSTQSGWTISQKEIQSLSPVELILKIQSDPQNHKLSYQLGMWYMSSGDFTQAEKVLRNLMAVENRVEVLTALAICAHELGDWAECIHLGRQAIFHPEVQRDSLFELLKNLGNSFVRLKDWSRAREFFEQAAVVKPDSDLLQTNLAVLAIQQGEWEEAVQRFRYALQLNPSNDKAWTGLGLCHQKKGDFELSQANLEMACDHNPLNETAIQLLFDVASKTGQTRSAWKNLVRYFEAGGRDAKALLLLSRWAIEKGKKKLAELALEEVILWNPAHMEAWELKQCL